jgi:diguanylate cyclase (GGDEF)-like protein
VRGSELHLAREVRDAARPAVRAELAVPMTRYGEPLGLLRVEAWRTGALGADELRIAEAIAAQATAAIDNARLYALATVDGLTGLYVRRYFDARLEEEMERSRRFGTSFALILLDLDDFKRLNDTHGHLAGDRALREVARGTAAQLRGVDIAGRYGGEEIAVILPRTPLASAAQVAERIRQAVAGIPLQMGSLQLRVTASLGVTAWVEGDTPATLLSRADRALYRAKGAGKDRVEIDAAPPGEERPAVARVTSARA